MNTITIELCQEDRARLDRLTDALGRLSNVQEALASVPAVLSAIPGPQEAPAAPAAPAVPAKPEPEEPVEPAPAQEAPAVDRADVQRKVVALSAAGKKDAVKEIVLAYGNTKVSDIPEDKLAEVLAKLTALEG